MCLLIFSDNGICRTLPNAIPIPKERAKSILKNSKKMKPNSSPFITAFATEKHMAKRIITKTSFTTVTP